MNKHRVPFTRLGLATALLGLALGGCQDDGSSAYGNDSPASEALASGSGCVDHSGFVHCPLGGGSEPTISPAT